MAFVKGYFHLLQYLVKFSGFIVVGGIIVFTLLCLFFGEKRVMNKSEKFLNKLDELTKSKVSSSLNSNPLGFTLVYCKYQISDFFTKRRIKEAKDI